MYKPPSPPSSAFPSTPTDTTTSGPLFPPINTSNNNNNISTPRPNIPPGHASPVRTPHPHDVLSGRGGRINSHPGNVHFREIIDAYKRQYLDPRT
eukprot:CAMPEP_0172307192 /NCGR_PEP_ID=MMETSP1058-20130122/8099_1 /TAXON_ID=83371 /ORGANISM="Detonula confervacea, Strain CCMP 353" /LENGTH=94 /DNA_ID=CAMNT_0013019287 /DNA_START=207 /DNA_END=488 /DNA_ORIENTATION=+